MCYVNLIICGNIKNQAVAISQWYKGTNHFCCKILY